MVARQRLTVEEFKNTFKVGDTFTKAPSGGYRYRITAIGTERFLYVNVESHLIKERVALMTSYGAFYLCESKAVEKPEDPLG